MTTKTYRLKIARSGQEFEAEGDKAFVLDMLKRFKLDQTPVVPPTHEGSSDLRPSRKPVGQTPLKVRQVSLREFIQRLGFKKHTDISLAFGYYLEKFSEIPEFTPADINNCYYEAKLDASNTSQMIIQNIKRGRMMPSKKKGGKGRNRYTLTASGETFVESKLDPNS